MAHFKRTRTNGHSSCGLCKMGKKHGEPKNKEKANQEKKNWGDEIRDAFNANLNKKIEVI